MLCKEVHVLYFIVFSMWAELLWELYLSMRQRRIYKHARTVPVELQGILTEEIYARARAYELDINDFIISADILSTIIITEMLLFEGFAYFWKVGGDIVEELGFESSNEILHSVAFMLLIYIFDVLVGLPFYIYYTFVLEEKHGFNKTTFLSFIADEIVALIVALAIILPVTAIIVAAVKKGGDYITVYLCSVTMITNLILLVIPNYIAPILGNFTPLPDGDLKRQIEELGESVGFPLDQIYVVEGPLNSTHSNAYVYGFFKIKGIVLYDTLLMDYIPEEESGGVTTREKRGCTNDEVVAILAHELGHWKLNHFLKQVFLQHLSFLFQVLVFGLLHKYEPMYCSFGFNEEKPVLIGLLIASFIIAPINAIIEFLEAVQTRRCEFLADEFAKSLGKAESLKSALIKLHQDNLILPEYDWLYSIWHHSHPPLLERLKALNDEED